MNEKEINDNCIVGFDEPTEECVFDTFEISHKKAAGARILYASYASEGYEGKAFVLFDRNDKLYEVNGAHCSCYGLEDQWEPEEVNVKELMQRMTTASEFLPQDGWGNHPKQWCLELYVYLGVVDQLQSRGYQMESGVNNEETMRETEEILNNEPGLMDGIPGLEEMEPTEGFPGRVFRITRPEED